MKFHVLACFLLFSLTATCQENSKMHSFNAETFALGDTLICEFGLPQVGNNYEIVFYQWKHEWDTLFLNGQKVYYKALMTDPSQGLFHGYITYKHKGAERHYKFNELLSLVQPVLEFGKDVWELNLNEERKMKLKTDLDSLVFTSNNGTVTLVDGFVCVSPTKKGPCKVSYSSIIGGEEFPFGSRTFQIFK
jgi:hypothetical protein